MLVVSMPKSFQKKKRTDGTQTQFRANAGSRVPHLYNKYSTVQYSSTVLYCILIYTLYSILYIMCTMIVLVQQTAAAAGVSTVRVQLLYSTHTV